MGSKKHKKHHRSEKKEVKDGVKLERQEKPLKLVLKVGGSSVQAPGSPSIQMDQSKSSDGATNQILPVTTTPNLQHLNFDPTLQLKEEKVDFSEAQQQSAQSSSHNHEKHKKSKKKKKKKSSDRDNKHQKRHKHHHHHHHHREHSHERKEKRRREHEHDHGAKEPPVKRALIEQPIGGVMMGDRPSRDPRSCTLTIKKKTTKTPLQMLLSYLLKNFQKKDPQQFFAWPVSDVIAPGYSSIISTPMDFSSMKQKIEVKDYSCLADFKHDLKLMCDNAMLYNRPDTIYYKAAKKMWHGQKLFNKEQLISLSRNLPFMLEMAPEELGFDPKEHVELEPVSMDGDNGEIQPQLLQATSPEAKKSKHKSSKHSIEEKSFSQACSDEDEDLALDEILIQAQKAAKGAADRLTLEKPNSKYAFLRQKDDGTTSLGILNPEKGAPNEIEVNLEMLVGKLSHGAGSITGFKEDAKNVVKPVKSLNYGSFSSYAPQYDSMFSNLTKDESCMVLTTYGDELGVQYAESLLSFAKDCDYVMNMVDSMLDALTGGTHSKTIKQLEERRKTAAVINAVEEQSKKMGENTAENNLFLGDLGLFSNNEDEPIKSSKMGLQQKLDETSGLLQDLAKVQNERLSATPPSHLSNIHGANNSELELADKVSRSLAEITREATPGSVVGLQSIRKAMGISYHPVLSPAHSTNSSSLQDQQKDESQNNSPSVASGKSTDSGEMHQDKRMEECDLRDFLHSNLQACESNPNNM